VILNNVPDNPGLFIKFSPVLDPDRFRDCYLNMVDITAVPERFKDTVSKTEKYYVLNGLLAQIVVYPVNLIFVKCL
jgi:hypothetical protein